MLDADPYLMIARQKPKLMADGATTGGIRSRARRRGSSCCGRPARLETTAGTPVLKTFQQVIESINSTLRPIDLERHGGRTIAGVTSRVLQRILALTAAIWHNGQLGPPTLRSLPAYDH